MSLGQTSLFWCHPWNKAHHLYPHLMKLLQTFANALSHSKTIFGNWCLKGYRKNLFEKLHLFELKELQLPFRKVFLQIEFTVLIVTYVVTKTLAQLLKTYLGTWDIDRYVNRCNKKVIPLNSYKNTTKKIKKMSQTFILASLKYRSRWQVRCYGWTERTCYKHVH